MLAWKFDYIVWEHAMLILPVISLTSLEEIISIISFLLPALKFHLSPRLLFAVFVPVIPINNHITRQPLHPGPNQRDYKAGKEIKKAKQKQSTLLFPSQLCRAAW